MLLLLAGMDFGIADRPFHWGRVAQEGFLGQNGYGTGSCWTEIQCTVVNSSIDYRPLYLPRPLFLSPPKGQFGRSLTGESFTCVIPACRRCAKRLPRSTSRVNTAADRP